MLNRIAQTLKASKTSVAFVIVVMVVFSATIFSSVAAMAAVGVDISRVGDASHFEFSGAADWKYDLKRDVEGGRVTLRIQGLKSDALTRLRSHADPLIKGVVIKENGVDGAAEISFAVANTSDFFDYITEQPSRLIVDFFPKETKPNDTKPGAKPDTKLPAKGSSLPKKLAAKSKKAVPDDDGDEAIDDADDEGSDNSDKFAANGLTKDITSQITGMPNSKAGAARKPAGDEFLTVGGADDKPSKAEEISSAKDFSHGIFDGGDPEFRRFSVKDYEVKEEAIIASRANFYLSFPMLTLGVPELKAMNETPPAYEIIPNDTRENKEARILLTLFSTGKKATFLKVAEEFQKKFPESTYDEIVRYMVADTYYEMWRKDGSNTDFESAMGLYQRLAEKYSNSPLAPRTALFMGYSYLERGDSFGALKAFQRFLRVSPNSKHTDQVNTSIAEAYLALNKYDDAFAMLDKLEKYGKTSKAREDAAFRKGDVMFRKADWAGAIAEYKAAAVRHPGADVRYPNAAYNAAEAEFRRKNYREALDSYRAFLQKFPDHEHGGYAMTRLGELLQILGADPLRVKGAFRESYFRYRATPGAGVARIRSLATRIPEMKDKELASAVREIAEITEKYANRPKSKAQQEKANKEAADAKEEGAKSEAKSEKAGEKKEEGAAVAGADDEAAGPNQEEMERAKKLELAGIEEFSTLLISDGFTARKEYDRAANDLIAYYQKNPQSPNKDRLKSRIVNDITQGIRQAVEGGDFIEGLRRWSKNSGGWLKNTERVDVRFEVGRAYEQAGVFKESSEVYRDCLKRIADLRAAGIEKDRRVFENMPTTDEIHLRLASNALREKDFSGAESNLKNITPVAAQLSDAEQIERAEVSADVAEARGQSEAARKYLTDLIAAWKGDAHLTSPLHLRIARLQMNAKDFKDADQHLSKVLEMSKTPGAVSDDVNAKALELRGDLALARGKRAEAIASFRQLLDQYEAKRPLASVRYRLGQILYEDGDLKSAEAAWLELKNAKDKMWTRLADEQMHGAKWQNEYRKYLNRIPAAADLRE